MATLISIFTTAGIVATLVTDASKFFSQVPLREVFSTDLAPLAREPSFGIIPLLTGTMMTSLVAMMVAIPAGLGSALYMSEFAMLLMPIIRYQKVMIILIIYRNLIFALIIPNYHVMV